MVKAKKNKQVKKGFAIVEYENLVSYLTIEEAGELDVLEVYTEETEETVKLRQRELAETLGKPYQY